MIYFSKSKKGFFLAALKAGYQAAGSWPSDAVKMTDAEVATYHGKQPPEGKMLGSDANGRPIWVDIPPPTLDSVNSQKLNQINSEAQKFIDANMPAYPEFEKLTFAKQEAEARAYVADNTVPTPVLSQIASDRGTTVDVLVPKVIAKADQFMILTSSVAGQRQKYEDDLAAAYTASDASAINAINPVYTAPA